MMPAIFGRHLRLNGVQEADEKRLGSKYRSAGRRKAQVQELGGARCEA
jgi:hypothetical protein